MRLLFLVFLLALSFFSPHTAYADTYGSGTYGSGIYGGSSSSLSSGSDGNAPNPEVATCTAEAPRYAPNLYQIDRVGETATLYFVPAGAPVDGYIITYGYSEGDERFSLVTTVGDPSGALSATITDLDPNASYIFKIRGKNGCQPGPWSALSIEAVTGAQKVSFYPSIMQQVTNFAQRAVQSIAPQERVVAAATKAEKKTTTTKPTKQPESKPQEHVQEKGFFEYVKDWFSWLPWL